MKFVSWFNESHILNLIGLTGVHSDEPRKARLWGNVFKYVVVIISVVLLLQWQMEILHTMTDFQSWVVNISVWLFFVLEFSVLMAFVKNRWRFLTQNWLLIGIIGFGFVILLVPSEVIVEFTQMVRPVLAIVILAPVISLLMSFFYDGKLRTTLLAAAVVVVIFGLLVDGVDPNIKTAWDGIWWAIVTVSTVGYGDVVPTSALGRLIAVGLIILGLGIFVTITANFLALVLSREVKGVKKEEERVKEIYDEVKEVKKEIKEIKRLLESKESKD